MTGSAWIMLSGTWAVVIFFAARFFWKVMTVPLRPHSEEASQAGDLVSPESRGHSQDQQVGDR